MANANVARSLPPRHVVSRLIRSSCSSCPYYPCLAALDAAAEVAGAAEPGAAVSAEAAGAVGLVAVAGLAVGAVAWAELAAGVAAAAEARPVAAPAGPASALLHSAARQAVAAPAARLQAETPGRAIAGLGGTPGLFAGPCPGTPGFAPGRRALGGGGGAPFGRAAGPFGAAGLTLGPGFGALGAAGCGWPGRATFCVGWPGVAPAFGRPATPGRLPAGGKAGRAFRAGRGRGGCATGPGRAPGRLTTGAGLMFFTACALMFAFSKASGRTCTAAAATGRRWLIAAAGTTVAKRRLAKSGYRCRLLPRAETTPASIVDRRIIDDHRPVDVLNIPLAGAIGRSIAFARRQGHPADIVATAADPNGNPNSATADEGDQGGGVNRPALIGAGDPAPAIADKRPTAIMERREAPRLIVDPGLSHGRTYCQWP